ncbi:unnamed protein product [Paramecium octaurelia]|uniref:Uncharacterized protein n=1 Tax=Paramecium octaurelia TaxID=43137 RepID=A0A8S1V8W6_PAROT|nr:unnamed protein product [Paramecium octaurelia]
MIRKKLENLRRERTKKMQNLLPAIVADRMAPSFFYYMFEPYVDFKKIAQSDAVQVQLSTPENAIAKGRRCAVQAARKSKALQMMGNQLKLSVDEQIESFAVPEEKGNPIKFEPYSLQRAALYDKGCITCGGPNISVTYHGERHICLKCRDHITTLDGDPVLIFQDDDGEVCVVGISDKKKLYFVQLDELKINGYRCYVTFSNENEIICLLHDSLNDKQKKDLVPPSALWQAEKDEQIRKPKGKNFVILNKQRVQK